MWCDMPAARGEKMVMSVPRSRWNLSCEATLARISSSLNLSIARVGAWAGSFKAAIWRLRNSSSGFGAVV